MHRAVLCYTIAKVVSGPEKVRDSGVSRLKGSGTGDCKNGVTKVENKELMDIDTAIAYAQLAVHTLKNSATELTDKSLKSEIKMLHDKFGTKEVIRCLR